MSTITDDHQILLAAGAIPADVAEAAGAYSVSHADGLPAGIAWDGPGLVFQYHPLDGPPVPQYRPDNPKPDAEGRLRKYLFPAGPVPLNIVPAMHDRITTASRVLIVEGTKQTLASVAHAPADVLVVGMAGCWGWSSDGIAHPDLGHLGIEGRPVVVALDADAATNQKVHDAGARLAEHLEAIGAESVKFLRLPAAGRTGLDDYLATIPDEQRGPTLGRLIAKARKLGRRPKATGPASALFDGEGIRVDAAFEKIRAEHHLCLDHAGRIATYSNGVYRAGRTDAADWTAIVTGLLGNAYRSHHARTLTEYAEGRLRAEGLVAGDDQHPGLVNLASGMLDPLTGDTHPHDPAHLSLVQLPVAWDPTATCPTFDAWLPTVVRAGLVDDLLESAAQLLETRLNRQQRRALFLHGPSRSGKSTFLRLLERLVGPHRSAVTLAQLSGDAFAAADLAGSILNSAADLSSAHLDDLSLFKALTGDDPVRAQRKYGQPFTFRARCLFVFSANAIPTASEVSTAYLNRVRPIPFPNTFAGAEDPTIEDRLALELPGILVRLVGAYQAHAARSGYLDTPATRQAGAEFAQASDRVRLFLAEATNPDPGGSIPRAQLFRDFETWCDDNRRQKLGKHKFFDLVRSAGLTDTKNATGTIVFRGITQRHPDDWGTSPAEMPEPSSPETAVSAVDRAEDGSYGSSPLLLPHARQNGEDEVPHARDSQAETAVTAVDLDPVGAEEF